jgi:Na+/H+-dicarboxylate symporter
MPTLALGLAVVSLVRPGVGVSIDGAACGHARKMQTSGVGTNDELPAAMGAVATEGASAPYALLSTAAAATGQKVTMTTDRAGSTTAAAEAHRGALDSILTTTRAAVPANVVSAAAEGNILGVIAASLMFGAALAAVGPDKADPLVRVVTSLNHVIEVMVGWAIALMPPGVLSLVAGRVAGWGCVQVESS